MASPRVELRIFRDRREAGRLLADALRPLGLEDPVVLALPRGGVPIAYEVARALEATPAPSCMNARGATERTRHRCRLKAARP